MEIDNSDSLSKFESDLSEIKFIEPSDSYVKKGHSLLKDEKIFLLGLQWPPISRNAFAFLASILVIVGTLTGFYMSKGGDIEFNLDSAEARVLDEKTQFAHQLVSSTDVLNLQANSNEVQVINSPESTVEKFLVANCQECHESQFLIDLIPKNIEGTTADISKAIRSYIISRMENIKS